MSFAGKTDKALQLRYFANALRGCLGLGPLYDIEQDRLHSEDQYKLEVPYPIDIARDWTPLPHDLSIRTEGFTAKHARRAQKPLNFQGDP